MFDPSSFVFRIPGDGGIQKVTLRFPTDEEWLAYYRTRRVIDKPMGRGSETEVQNADKADAALVSAIAPDHGLNAAQCALIAGKLLRLQIEEVENAGDRFTIRTRFFGGVATHVLKMPSAQHMKDWEGASRQIALERGKCEYRTNLEAYGRIYDDLKVSVDGYGNWPIPIIHKVSAATAAMQELRSLIDGDGEDFF